MGKYDFSHGPGVQFTHDQGKMKIYQVRHLTPVQGNELESVDKCGVNGDLMLKKRLVDNGFDSLINIEGVEAFMTHGKGFGAKPQGFAANGLSQVTQLNQGVYQAVGGCVVDAGNT